MSPHDLTLKWGEIARQAGRSEDGPYLHLQMMGGDVPIGVILRANDKRQGLLIRFAAEDLPRLPHPDPNRGFSFERPVPAGSGMLGLPILLADPGVSDLFAIMGADLISEVERLGSGETGLERVLRRMALWRRFFQHRGGLLTHEEQQGLFGELHVLSLVMAKDGIDAALDAWQGPDRKLHDFRFVDGLIEVKCWRAESGGRVYISQPDQISVDPNRPIHLAAVQISVGGGSGKALGEMIGSLKSRMNGIQGQRFDELLAEYGYLQAHAHQYSDRVHILGMDLYEVRKGFPHLDVRSLPGGVIEVRYALELGALAQFQTANLHLKPSP
jgi:hypothetical protein